MQRLRHRGGDGDRGVRHAGPSTTERRAALRASLPAPPRIPVAAPCSVSLAHTCLSSLPDRSLRLCACTSSARAPMSIIFENSALAPRPAARSSVAAAPLCSCLPSCASALRLHCSRFYPSHSFCGCRQATKFCCLLNSYSMRFRHRTARDVSPSSATTRRLDARVDIDSGDPVTHRWPAPEPLLSHHPLPTGGEERAGQWARSSGDRATGRRPIGEAARRRGRRRARRRRRRESRKVGR